MPCEIAIGNCLLPYRLTVFQVLRLYKVNFGLFRTGILVFSLFGFFQVYCFMKAAIPLWDCRNSLELKVWSSTVLIMSLFCLLCLICVVCTMFLPESTIQQQEHQELKLAKRCLCVALAACRTWYATHNLKNSVSSPLYHAYS